jgi:hypothetical protein
VATVPRFQGQGRPPGQATERGRTMTEATVSFAGNLTDDPELRHTEAGIARATFRVAVSGRREQEPSFFTVVVWRDQAEHAAHSLSRVAGSWSWAGSSSGAGRPRTAAPDPLSRSSPRSWAKPSLGDGDHDQDYTQLAATMPSRKPRVVLDTRCGFQALA